jgi:hypothetical protein
MFKKILVILFRLHKFNHDLLNTFAFFDARKREKEKINQFIIDRQQEQFQVREVSLKSLIKTQTLCLVRYLMSWQKISSVSIIEV